MSHKPYYAEELWLGIYDPSPSALDWAALWRVEPNLSEIGKTTLKALIKNLDRNKRWLIEAREAVENEAAHIERIGLMMKRAGLRSYTDKEGRIFVSESRGTE